MVVNSSVRSWEKRAITAADFKKLPKDSADSYLVQEGTPTTTSLEHVFRDSRLACPRLLKCRKGGSQG